MRVYPAINLLAAFCLALCALPTARAEEPPSAITVVMDDNYPPFVFREDSGELAGLLVDQWKLWQARTGIAVRIEAMDWIDAQLKMSSGAADVIDTIFRTVEREKLYDFTAPYADIEAQIFFNRELGGFGSIEALRGFTIGVKAGDASIDFLRSRGINSLQLFNNYETMVMAAVRGDLLVFCVDKPPALYYLYKLRQEKKFRSSISLYTGQFHRAVAKGRSELLKLVEAGFAGFSRAEREELEKKWLGRSLDSDDFLRPLLFGTAAAAGLAVLLTAWSLTLRRRVKQKTALLTAAMRQLSAAKDEAERAARAKGRFLSNMSHEIRTPLNGLIGMLRLLRAGPLSADQRRYADLMGSSSALLLGIINDVLDLAAIESGMRVPRPEPVDARAAIQSLIEGLSIEASAKGLELGFRADASLPPALMLDPAILSRIALNLAGNAVKFTERGRIELRLSAAELEAGLFELTIEVEDSGIGIPADRLPELFKPYSQLESDMGKRHAGSGLGLAIVRELAGLAGGGVTVRSEPGRGSTFTARLRARAAEAAPAAQPSAAAAPPSVGAGPAAPLRILVAEDNAINLLYLESLLLRQGHAVDTAMNGKLAVELAAASSEPYDLILMDIQMPEMDGLAALAAIRALGPAAAAVPVIALTGYAMEEDLRAIRAGGFTAAVIKPIDESLLMQTIVRAAPAGRFDRGRLPG